jgi:hypothetical protein
MGVVSSSHSWGAAMMLGWRFVMVAGVLLVSFPLASRVLAQQTGNELVSDCDQLLGGLIENSQTVQYRPTFEGGRCWGFMAAVQELSTLSYEAGRSLTYECLPPTSSLVQLARVSAEYGHRHPEELHNAAGTFALSALTHAFPCP